MKRINSSVKVYSNSHKVSYQLSPLTTAGLFKAKGVPTNSEPTHLYSLALTNSIWLRLKSILSVQNISEGKSQLTLAS